MIFYRKNKRYKDEFSVAESGFPRRQIKTFRFEKIWKKWCRTFPWEWKQFWLSSSMVVAHWGRLGPTNWPGGNCIAIPELWLSDLSQRFEHSFRVQYIVELLPTRSTSSEHSRSCRKFKNESDNSNRLEKSNFTHVPLVRWELLGSQRGNSILLRWLFTYQRGETCWL